MDTSPGGHRECSAWLGSLGVLERKLCVRGGLGRVQEKISVRERPVQRSWGGNDLCVLGEQAS